MNKIISKPLPHSLEAEQSVLGSIFLDPPTAFTAMGILKASDFYFNKHALIFKAVTDLCNEDRPVDVLTVSESLKKDGALDEAGGLEYLSFLEDCIPTSKAISHFCQIVKNKAVQRKLIKVGESLYQKAWGETEKPETLIDETQNSIYDLGLELQNKGGSKLVYDPGEWSMLALETAAHWLENPEQARGIKTGFNKLDSVTNGLKDVNIISASTGIGKTALGLNMAVNIGIFQKIPVLYVNLEMNLEDLMVRVQGILSGIPCRTIIRGEYSSQHPFSKVDQATEAIKGGKLYITGNEPKNINAISGLIHRYKVQKEIQVVVVDYLGEIEPDSLSQKEGSEYLTYGRWTQQLKHVCASLGVKLVLLAQLNREGQDSPQMNKIGGSWKIAQKADVFMILSVDKKGQHFLKVVKNRNGEAPKTIELDFYKPTQRVAELS